MPMRAAVVRSFDRPPRYEIYDPPEPDGPDEAAVEVLAAGLHPRVRTDASGRYYTSTGMLPMIPGIDGVGRLPDGRCVYFVAPHDGWGSMAERAVVDLRRVVVLPGGIDPLKVAAAMNPAMSSWVALRHRLPLLPGQSVLILGATGNAGAMAVQVAKRLRAGRVVGAGRRSRRRRRLPLGRTGGDRHDGVAQGPGRPQPSHELDPDRGDCRGHLGAAVRRPSFGQPKPPG
jgi:NADPH:quinone reductase-like Zn-dependent oxidoreductase